MRLLPVVRRGLEALARPLAGAARFGRRLRRDRDGVAAVEFALIAPVMMILLLGSTEVVHLIWASGRLSSTVSAVGDVLTQEREVSNDVFTEVTSAIPLLMKPYYNSTLSVNVVSVMACAVSGATRYYVTWSRKWSNGSISTGPYAIGSRRTADLTGINLPDGDTMVFVEAKYTYDSRQVLGWGAAKVMTKTVSYQPRNSRRIYDTNQERTPYKTCYSFISSGA